GFFAPRECHVYDLNGQVDPLMARLSNKIDSIWIVGHLIKAEVQGYRETLTFGENRIVDPALAAYYEKLRLITRGDLLWSERVKAIVAINLGWYDHLIASPRPVLYPPSPEVHGR